MSQIDVCDNGRVIEFESRVSARPGNNISSFVRAAHWVIGGFAEWRQRRRTMEMLRQLSDKELCDIGFDPAAVFGERVGTIGEVHGDRFHGF